VIGIDTDLQKCTLAESFGIRVICTQANADVATTVLGLTNEYLVEQ